jgi:hypothetical protein
MGELKAGRPAFDEFLSECAKQADDHLSAQVRCVTRGDGGRCAEFGGLGKLAANAGAIADGWNWLSACCTRRLARVGALDARLRAGGEGGKDVDESIIAGAQSSRDQDGCCCSGADERRHLSQLGLGEGDLCRLAMAMQWRVTARTSILPCGGLLPRSQRYVS